jgi:hypothetical protein
MRKVASAENTYGMSVLSVASRMMNVKRSTRRRE